MDVVVTVPKTFEYSGAPGLRGLAAWIAEGDAAGDPATGEEWGFYTGGIAAPKIEPGERVYIVCEGRVRGYAPLVRLIANRRPSGSWYDLCFCRAGDAVAVTIAEPVTGFRGWRYRWWEREHEVAFPDWKTARMTS